MEEAALVDLESWERRCLGHSQLRDFLSSYLPVTYPQFMSRGLKIITYLVCRMLTSKVKALSFPKAENMTESQLQEDPQTHTTFITSRVRAKSENKGFFFFFQSTWQVIWNLGLWEWGQPGLHCEFQASFGYKYAIPFQFFPLNTLSRKKKSARFKNMSSWVRWHVFNPSTSELEASQYVSG